MGTARKKELQRHDMKCIECRVAMERTMLDEEGISFEGYRCPQCGNTVLTLEQLKGYNNLRDLKKAIAEKRKVVRIGNSLGITLPNILKDYGLKAGNDVEIKVVDLQNLHIKLC